MASTQPTWIATDMVTTTSTCLQVRPQPAVMAAITHGSSLQQVVVDLAVCLDSHAAGTVWLSCVWQGTHQHTSSNTSSNNSTCVCCHHLSLQLTTHNLHAVLPPVIRYDLEYLGLCPCMVDVEIIDAKNDNQSIFVSAGPEACACNKVGKAAGYIVGWQPNHVGSTAFG